MKIYNVAELERSFDQSLLADATVSVYTSLTEAESVWRRAVEHCACFLFQTFEWNAAWRDTVGRTEATSECIVHVAAADGRTLLILPFAISNHRHLQILQFLGGAMTDYNAPLVDNDFAREVGASDITRLWRLILRLLPSVEVVWLQRMPKTIDGARNPLAELSHVRHTDDAFAATLPASFEEFTSTRSTQFFAQIRRHRRRLEKHGPADVSFPAESGARLNVLHVLAEQKSNWLRSNGHHNAFEQPATREFYERLTEGTLQDGKIMVACLRVGDQITATLWGAVFGRRYYFLLPSYSEQWKNYSAGRILTQSVLQRCIDQGDVRIFDLTICEEGYKRTWSDHCLPLHEYLEARSLKGIAFVTYRRARSAIRRNRRIRTFARALSRRARARFQGGVTSNQASA